MERYLCIHGHFYQPPRENPWLEAVEFQESAEPYHDWNDRITDECYAANARSRILDSEGRIERIVNNYTRISFNFGPTLLSWMESFRPEVYRAIIDADRESTERFSGHGSAMAQAYNHMILPLANARDRRTQVLWGIHDFRRRFGRMPEGMWLPETAANTETLEVLAELGLRFTILAPRQAARFRKIGDEDWTDANSGIDPTRAYLQRLPSGRTISLFFYDGPVSQGVAFERLLETGERFAGRLMEIFDDQRDWPQLAHIATDGETYGHHHRHGDMALAYALDHVERNNLARLTNYAEFLERHPPTHEVQIVENSSWSCIHGVERWRSNCGCNSGRAGWNQEWRAPLRAALDWLRDACEPLFESRAGSILRDPWAARDDYIELILDRSPDRVEAFLPRHAAAPLDDAGRVKALSLLEMQRQLMLMYTSCGWFFDELSGIETVQVTQYAGRAIQLAREATGQDLEPGFMERLERAPSNLHERPNGKAIYQDFVKPSFVDLPKLAAHYAISSLFDEYPESARIYAYEVERSDAQTAAAGRARMLVGRARFTSRITRESREMAYGVLHLGDHILNAGVRDFPGEEAYAAVVERMRTEFAEADYPGFVREMDAAFGGTNYTLQSLFKDEQRRAVEHILGSTLGELQRSYRQVYEHHAPLLRFLAQIHATPPRALRVTAEIVLNAALARALRADDPDPDRARAVLAEAREGGVRIDEEAVAYAAGRLLGHLAERFAESPADTETIRAMTATVEFADDLGREVRLDQAQNAVYPVLHQQVPAARAEGGGPAAWASQIVELARRLHLRVE